MSRTEVGGSKFLYEPFQAANVRIDANEKVAEARWAAVDQRLKMIERTLERLERRMWLAVSGMATFLATDVVYSLLAQLK